MSTNIAALTSITGKTDLANVTQAGGSVLSATPTTGQVFKVNSLLISNIDGTDDADVTVQIVRGGNSYALASTIVVPADATLVVISKDMGIYLEANDDIECAASADGDLQAVLSYEIVS
jgi:hypothetical protein